MHRTPKLRSLLEVAAIHLIRGLLRPLPLAWVSRAGAGLGWLLFAVFRVQRRQVLRNLELAFGEGTAPAKRVRLAARCYRHFGAVLAEFLSLPRLRGGAVLGRVTVENQAVLADALAAGRGCLLVSGHLGNWELICPTVAALGFPVSVYVGEQHNPRVDDAINALRRAGGAGLIPKRTAMPGMVRALRRGHAVGMLPDQHYSRNRHFIRFFGRPVSTPPGAGTLVRHTGAPVVFAEAIRTGPWRCRLRFTPVPVPEPSGDAELDLLRVAQAVSDALEDAVRRHPEQYFWMHRRWRTVPPPERLSETNRAFLAASEPGAGASAAPGGALSSGAGA